MELSVLPSHRLSIWIDPVGNSDTGWEETGTGVRQGGENEGPEFRGWKPQEQ